MWGISFVSSEERQEKGRKKLGIGGTWYATESLLSSSTRSCCMPIGRPVGPARPGILFTSLNHTLRSWGGRWGSRTGRRWASVLSGTSPSGSSTTCASRSGDHHTTRMYVCFCWNWSAISACWSYSFGLDDEEWEKKKWSWRVKRLIILRSCLGLLGLVNSEAMFVIRSMRQALQGSGFFLSFSTSSCKEKSSCERWSLTPWWWMVLACHSPSIIFFSWNNNLAFWKVRGIMDFSLHL